MRINKFIASSSGYSRRKADELVEQGRVEVNGITGKMGQEVDVNRDAIKLDGKTLNVTSETVYIMLNKPKGVLSTVSDDRDRKTVIDLVKSPVKLFPIGRLDYDTTGLILLTNDGELALRLTHPKFHTAKIYELKIQGRVSPEDLSHLASGVELEDGMTSPADANVIFVDKGVTTLELTIHEGKKRQVRRMCQALHLKLLDLKRIAIGPITLDNLKEGTFRDLTAYEVQQLKTV